jgi:hypothetical protein
MKRFDGKALSWALADRVVELALHRPPANELSMASWAELEQFVEALKSLESEAVALIIYSQLKSGFGAHTYAKADDDFKRDAAAKLEAFIASKVSAESTSTTSTSWVN